MPFVPKFWIASWHMEGKGARCVLEAVPFPAAVSDAAECAEGRGLS